MRPSFSLGIEEEYQTIDPVTRDLRSHIETEMLAHGKLRLQVLISELEHAGYDAAAHSHTALLARIARRGPGTALRAHQASLKAVRDDCFRVDPSA